MTFEVELKARLRQPEAVEKQIAGLGAFVGEIYKEDVYFKRQGDTALIPTDRYRLRREGPKAVVTFKQMVTADNVEVNDEVEFEVSDVYAFFRFTDRFGFEPFVVKRKKSRVYRIGRANIELNEVEHLGHFVEIEILCDHEADIPAAQTELTRLLGALGLTEADLEPRRYLALIQQAHPVQYRFINDPTLDWPFEEVA
ncbi:MAG: class IV adenylate cyclase [Anaerolineae bacterium]|nr:class IV adenylate cyclase [Anaerolineae bacterium]